MTEQLVTYKNGVLQKFDEHLNTFRQKMESGLTTIKSINEFNINQIVETLLGHIKRGGDSVLDFHIGIIVLHERSLSQEEGH